MKHRFIFIIAIFSITQVAWAEEKTAPHDILLTLSLKEAKDIALKQHPEILSSGYQIKAAKQGIKEARANYFPQVGVNAVRAFAGDNTRLAAIGGINNPTVFDRASYGVSASQLITDFGRTNHQVDAAIALKDAQSEHSLSVRDKVLFEVSSSYYNLMRAKKIMLVAEATQKVRKSLLEKISLLRDAKMKSDLDVSIGKQSVSEADLLSLQAKNNFDDAQANLSQALGYNSKQSFIIQDDSREVSPADDLDKLLQQAKDNNPELQALRAKLRAARKQEEAEQAANYPTVSAIGYAGENPIRDRTKLDANYAAAGVTISISLFTGGKLTAIDKRAEYQAQAIEQDLMDKENQIARDVRLSWNNMQAAYKNISVSKELSKNSDEALELTQARYDIGKSSITDLNQAQLTKTQAEIQNTNATYDYLIKQAFLESMLGGES